MNPVYDPFRANLLVTGAFGVIGSAVVQALSHHGFRFASSARGGALASFATNWRQADLSTGEGLDAAMEGRTAVIHCATRPAKPSEDIRAMDRLIESARKYGTHIVYPGIAGIECTARHVAYHRAKLECERRLAASGVSYTLVRSTLLHDFIDRIFRRMSFGSWLLAPHMTLQPVDGAYVASELVALALDRPMGRVDDLHGPQSLDTVRLSKAWFARKAGPKRWFPVPSFGPLRCLSELGQVKGHAGGVTWSEWLAMCR
jgi:uncharacterized protein YbjT (DUF2867 family)